MAHAATQKAVDPRAPPPQQVVQEESQQHDNEEYGQNEYSGWDASNMGHEQGHNEGQGYDQMGMNGYNDQGAGSPAIKEDGYVFTMNFLSTRRLRFVLSERRNCDSCSQIKGLGGILSLLLMLQTRGLSSVRYHLLGIT